MADEPHSEFRDNLERQFAAHLQERKAHKMTQAPIHPRHKDEAANILARPLSDCTIAQTLANLEAARADLAEIDLRLADLTGEELLKIPEPSFKVISAISVIAAPYRASDPVAEALKVDIDLSRIGWGQIATSGGNFDVDALIEVLRAQIERKPEDGNG